MRTGSVNRRGNLAGCIRTLATRCAFKLCTRAYVRKLDMAMILMRPQAIPDNFRWRGKYFHLTYAEFHEKQDLLAAVVNATTVPLVGWSYCQEDTTKTLPNGTRIIGHQHTHFCIMFESAINLVGSRAFDIHYVQQAAVIGQAGQLTSFHPNIQPKVHIAQVEQIFTHYHMGRKFDIEQGKVVYTAPVKVEQHLPPLFEFHRTLMHEVSNAPNIIEACLSGNVRPRTVNDIITLRNEAARAPKRFKHKFDRATFKTFNIDPNWQTLHIHGPTNYGKTKWACAQFDNPCFIKPFKSVSHFEALLKTYDPEFHDGIVLDEVNFSFVEREEMIAFTDPDEECILHIRFGTANKPLPPCRKIFISNHAPQLLSNCDRAKLYPFDDTGAMARRVTVFHITEQTYHLPAPAPVLHAPAPAAFATQP